MEEETRRTDPEGEGAIETVLSDGRESASLDERGEEVIYTSRTSSEEDVSRVDEWRAILKEEKGVKEQEDDQMM